MLRSVFGKTLWERRQNTLWWTIGLVTLAAITAAFVPSIQADAEGFQALFENLPEGLLSVFGVEDAAALVTPTGLMNSRLYTGIGPVLVAVLGVGLGTAAIVGEEDRGTLDMLLAQPLLRSRLILEKTGATLVIIAIVVAALFATLVVANPIVDLEFSLANTAAANVGLGLLAFVHFGFALAVGAITGSRGLTVGVSAGFIGAAFFINGLAPLVDQLSQAQRLTPFYWLQEPDPLANGFAWDWFALMAAVGVVLVGIAIAAFNRRDVGV